MSIHVYITTHILGIFRENLAEVGVVKSKETMLLTAANTEYTKSSPSKMELRGQLLSCLNDDQCCAASGIP